MHHKESGLERTRCHDVPEQGRSDVVGEIAHNNPMVDAAKSKGQRILVDALGFLVCFLLADTRPVAVFFEQKKDVVGDVFEFAGQGASTGSYFEYAIAWACGQFSHHFLANRRIGQKVLTKAFFEGVGKKHSLAGNVVKAGKGHEHRTASLGGGSEACWQIHDVEKRCFGVDMGTRCFFIHAHNRCVGSGELG